MAAPIARQNPLDTIPPQLLLALAALGGGALNSIAGGGSFLTFPALVYCGVPPLAANATSAMAVAPGYLGGALGFGAELRARGALHLLREAGVAAVGGLAGALLLLVTPARVFSWLVPWLLLFATVLFAIGPALARLARSQTPAGPYVRLAGLLAVSVYGGYFNGGLGILLMALYTVAGERDLHTINGLKNLNSLVLSVLSVAAFAWAGVIVWPSAVLMMAAATVGGYFGARLAHRLPVSAVRALVVITGLAMALWFLLRQ